MKISAHTVRAAYSRLALVCVLVVAACARPAPRAATPSAPILFAVVTWNMHAGAGDLPRLVDDLQSGRLAGAPIATYVLLLQEAIEGGAHDVTALAAARSWHAYYSPVRRSAQRVSGNAIVASVPLLEPRAIVLPRERQPRGAVTATVTIESVPLVIVDAHLENRVTWRRGGLLSDRARGRQADALLRAIPADRPAIVGGDFNTWLGPNEPAWKRLAERFPHSGESRQPTFHDRLILDHLYFDLPAGWQATQFVARDRYGSDHHPVVGVVVRGPASTVPSDGARGPRAPSAPSRSTSP